MINQERVSVLRDDRVRSGPIIYWMGRDQRVRNNWALLYAAGMAKKETVPLIVFFNVVPEFLGATLRHYDFMLKGLQEVEASLKALHIPFVVSCGEALHEVNQLIREVTASALVMDFDPLRPRRQWKESLMETLRIRMVEVDAHNVVPCIKASDKSAFGAYTLRPKIHRLLPVFLSAFPDLPEFKDGFIANDWARIRSSVKADRSVLPVKGIIPGETAANKALDEFVNHRLASYHEQRNDPNLQGQSGLSPWLHFGQLSAQAVALAVRAADAPPVAKEALLEELIVRRELSDNFCHYIQDYDNLSGIPSWARSTLEAHRFDERAFIYHLTEFETARTHDPLWNAAQTQLVVTGKMHGYMRMYWAKKMLEWSETPESAISIAIALNDKYSLDGRDPNGYAGILWSIGGLHDRAWGERPVFGKIRYMNAAGCKRKFDVNKYITTNSWPTSFPRW